MTAETSGKGAVRIPTIDDIRTAREVLEGVSIYTPMEGARWLSDLAGGRVLIKAENPVSYTHLTLPTILRV